MGRAWVHRRLLGGAAVTVVASAIAWVALGPTPASGAGECASLGEAAHFVAFSHAGFNASPPGGENISGRIAAAGDVTLGGPGSGGLYVTGASGDVSPTVIAGHDLSAGKSGVGGTLSSGATYGNGVSVAPNFYVTPPPTKASAPFSFDDEFTSLRTLSASLAGQAQSDGSTVSLNPYSHALELNGTGAGLNVFTVSAAQLTQAAGVTITLTTSGATALINVTTDTDLTVSLQYMNLSGASAASIAWNLPLATKVMIGGPEAWQGLLLAPNAAVSLDSNGQFNGQVIAASVPAANRTLNKVAFAGCLPPPQPISPPDESLTLNALCVDINGDLDMRLRNTGDEARSGEWVDQGGTDFGHFDDPAHHDLFFDVQNPTSTSVIAATSGATTVTAPGTTAPCRGQITVRLITAGPAPAGATWDVRLDAGVDPVPVTTLGSGEQSTRTVPGGYLPGSVPIDQVVGGVAYTVSVPDTLGGSAFVSLNPIEILDGQHEIVTVVITFEESGGGEPEKPNVVEPGQPTLPPGSPDPLPGPDLGSSASGTDLSITNQITPRRIPVDGTVSTVTHVRNVGQLPAVGVVAREIPQYHPAQANTVAHVLSLTTTRGHCTAGRPVHCDLGTLAPGTTVTIRTRTRVLVAASLRSIVVVSSDTAETNTTNNMSIARVTSFAPTANIRAGISAPPLVHVGQRLRYRVTVTSGTTGAHAVRLCTKTPATLIAVHAPGTFAYHGRRCATAAHLGAGRSLSFTVSGLASARGHVFPSTTATAVDAARPAGASTHVVVLGPVVACTATARRAMTARRPRARAAC
ncbi:MAG TPA: collagen-binding domain-containing protein [Solirubrobacteraceae bacterium]